MNFIQGSNNTTNEQQLIASFIYMINTYANILLHSPSILPKLSVIDNEMYHHSGTNTDQSYLGAVRAGFEALLSSQPKNVLDIVHAHLNHTIILLSEKINKDIIDCDIIFGYKDPFNFYNTGVRYQYDHPLISFEVDNNKKDVLNNNDN